jgi:hypothetical protein
MKKVVFVLLYLSCLCSILNGHTIIRRWNTFNLNGLEPEIIDSKAQSLGRASLFTSSGANNLFNNTSMLSKFDCKNIQVSYRINYGESKSTNYDFSNTYTNYYKFHMKLNGIAFSTSDLYQFSNKLKINLAIGYRTYIDWGYKRETSTYIIDSNGGLNLIVLGSSICIKDTYFFGLSYNYPFQCATSTKFKSNNVLYDSYKTNGTMKASFFVLSSSYIINKSYNISVRFRPDFKLKREFKISDDEDIDTKIEYDVPYELAIAVKILSSDHINIFAEYLTCNLGEYKQNDEYLYSLDDNDKSENGHTIRIGLEYNENYRLGFYSQSVPIYTHPSRVSNKPQTEFGFTAGYGFILSSILNVNCFTTYSFLNYDDFYGNCSDFRIKAGCSVGYSF